MPPKPESKPPTKKKAPPVQLCGCGVNTYRPAKRKIRKREPIVHNSDCTFQRHFCPKYPDFPQCIHCQKGCDFCGRSYDWCPHCYEYPCLFRFKRQVLPNEMIHDPFVTRLDLAQASASQLLDIPDKNSWQHITASAMLSAMLPPTPAKKE